MENSVRITYKLLHEGSGLGFAGSQKQIPKKQTLLGLSGFRASGFKTYPVSKQFSGASPAATDADIGSERGSLNLQSSTK